MQIKETSKLRQGKSGWLWQHKRMQDLRFAFERIPESRKECISSACLALSQAKHLTDSPPYNAQEFVPALALHLYAKAAYWAVVSEAYRADEQSNVPEHTQFSPPETFKNALVHASINLDELCADHELLSDTLGLFERLEKSDWLEPSTRNHAVEAELMRLSERLVERADNAAREIQRIWFQRLVRVGIPFALLIMLLVTARIVRSHTLLEQETMFPWRTSTANGERGCQSPRQGCEQDHFFFHTKLEKEPWIEFDISRLETISEVTILNRTDCQDCSIRAVPLLVEVSENGTEWLTVARRETDFVSWSTAFPRTNAKFLRLRVLKRTPFHLKQVRIKR